MMLKKVYISSTYKDLVPYRNAIRDMFGSKGLQDEYSLVSMEGYVSENNKRAIEVCLEDVQNADIYILILAKRYGSIVEGTNKSYTEMEYDEAMKTAKTNSLYKIFVFWSNDENEKDDFAGTAVLENPALENFYTTALNDNACFTSPFTTPDNLCKQILLTFNYSFKKPNNLSDYKDALLLVDRVKQSYDFSRFLRNNTNSFNFSSQYANNPNDFVERIYGLEMGGQYNKCNIELGQFTSIDVEKFTDTFIAQLSTQWTKNVEKYEFQDTEKLFLSVEINSEQIKSGVKMDNLHKVLSDFLPKFLTTNGENCANHVFFIFYSFIASENNSTEKFDAFIKKLTESVQIDGCLTSMDQLSDVPKIDTENWLKNYIKGYTWDLDELDDLLQVGDNPFKTFKMKEVNKLIKTWIRNNLFKN